MPLFDLLKTNQQQLWRVKRERENEGGKKERKRTKDDWKNGKVGNGLAGETCFFVFCFLFFWFSGFLFVCLSVFYRLPKQRRYELMQLGQMRLMGPFALSLVCMQATLSLFHEVLATL